MKEEVLQMDEKIDTSNFDITVSAIFCWRCNLALSSFSEEVCPACRQGDKLQIVDMGPRILCSYNREVVVWSYHQPGTMRLVPVVCTNIHATVGGGRG